MLAAAIVLWVCAGMLVYVYAGYPLLIGLMARVFRSPVGRAPIRPTVSVVITAYNEELEIRTKLDNVLSLEYPPPPVEVIVASDGSSDGTDAIVRTYESRRVRLLRIEERRGKTACQNAAVQVAAGDIVVFTDATTRIEPRALIALAENFSDALVGCVSGALVYVAKGQSLTAQGGTAYWSYERSLRQAESDFGSLVGVSGCLYAVRRSAYRPLPPELISDFVIGLRMRELGLRTVLDPEAVCFEDTNDRPGTELAMRVRVAIRSINALVHERRFLNPRRYGTFALQLWSHKVLRYASPFLWLAVLGANLCLLVHPIYRILLASQGLVLALGGAGFLVRDSRRRLSLLKKPYYFVLTNVASFLAALRYLGGERMVTWKPMR
jgi:cellulose synthase/poly-beta-1,6-N-acetylglucosamine synthase-like glycosyltransferase